jgi:hypothetical protein
MHVIMRHEISGTRNGAHWPAKGSGVDLPDDEAAHLVTIGYAIASKPVSVAKVVDDVETAIVSAPVETATPRRGRPPKSGR